MENLTDEQKKKIEAQIKKFQSEEQGGKDLQIDNFGTRGKKVLRLDKVPNSIGLSYSANKSSLLRRIDLKRGGEQE